MTKLKTKAKAFYILLSTIVFLVSCQSTPEEIIVQNKNDNELEEKIFTTDDLEIINDFPEQLTETVETNDGFLKVIINSSLVIPDGSTYPVISIVPMEITQEWADMIISVLIGDAVLYEEQYALTTEEINSEIQASYQYITEELSEYETTDPDYYKSQYDDRIEWITYLNELLETSTNEKKIHSGLFESMNGELQVSDAESTRKYMESKGYSEEEIEEMMENYNSQINEQQFICGMADLGKARMATLEINKYSEKQQQVQFYNTESGSTTGTDFLIIDESIVDEIEITYEEALATAEEIILSLGITNMELYVAGAAQNYDSNGEKSGYMYKLIFTRTFNQVPVTYVAENRYNTYSSSEAYREPWYDEQLIISVDTTGIVGFKWVNPIQVNEVLNDNVEILAFEEIKNIFLNQIIINNAYQEESNIEHKEINITRITLGLVKIARKNSDGYMYVPAWDFFGTLNEEYTNDIGEYTEDSYGISFMTINAIDGTIIDRSLGY